MQPTLKHHHEIHLARKIWHFCGVVFLAVCYHNLGREQSLNWLLFFGTLAIAFDLARLNSPKVNEFAIRWLGPIMRDSEKNRLAGTTYLIVGVFVIILFFDPLIVKLSLLFLALADPIASYFGIRYGRDRLFGRKSLQGTFAAFITCLVISLFYFYSKELMLDRLFIVSILAGLSGAFSEALPAGKLDDNLILPIMSSCLLYFIYTVFGGFPIA